MGLFMVFGSAARIAGPAFAGPALSWDDQQWTFGILVGVWGVGLILLLLAFTRLNPQPPTDTDAAGADESETAALVDEAERGKSGGAGAVSVVDDDGYAYAAGARHVQEGGRGGGGDVYVSYGTLVGKQRTSRRGSDSSDDGKPDA